MVKLAFIITYSKGTRRSAYSLCLEAVWYWGCYALQILQAVGAIGEKIKLRLGTEDQIHPSECVICECITLIQIMGTLLTQISGSLTVFLFTSPSSYKVHELVFLQAGLNQKRWSGNTCNMFEVLVDIGSLGRGNKEPEINSWYTYCMGIEPSAGAVLYFRCTSTGLCYIQCSHHMHPLKQAELWT